MSNKRYRKGYNLRPLVPINDHAYERFRQHWPMAMHLYNTELQLLLSDQILDALNRADFVVAPGGVYVPISVLGQDGYAVLVDQRVRTVMPLAYCAEVEKVRRR